MTGIWNGALIMIAPYSIVGGGFLLWGLWGALAAVAVLVVVVAATCAAFERHSNTIDLGTAQVENSR